MLAITYFCSYSFPLSPLTELAKAVDLFLLFFSTRLDLIKWNSIPVVHRRKNPVMGGGGIPDAGPGTGEGVFSRKHLEAHKVCDTRKEKGLANICHKKREEKRTQSNRNLKKRRNFTSSKKTPLNPIHSQQHPSPHTNALGKIHTAPGIHSPQPAREIPTLGPEIKDGGIPHVGQGAEMSVLEGAITRIIEIAITDIISPQPGRHARHPRELPR